MAHRPGQRLGGQAAEPDRRVRPLHRLRAGWAGRRRRGTGRGTSPWARRTRPPSSARRPSVKYEMKVSLSTPKAANWRAPPPGATPMSSRPWLSRSTAVTDRGQLQRLVQRRHQDGDAQAQPLGAGRAIRQQLQRRQQRRRADGLLEHPAALEPELLGAGTGMSAARRRRSRRSRTGGWRSKTSPDHRTAADRYAAEHVRLSAFSSRCRRRPGPGRPGRYRPPPRRAQRLRARIQPAFGAAGDDGLRPAGDHHRGRSADGAARRRRRDPPRRRGPAGRRADRPRAARGVAAGGGPGAAGGDRGFQRRQAVAGVGRDLSGHAVLLPGFGVRRGLDAALGKLSG